MSSAVPSTTTSSVSASSRIHPTAIIENGVRIGAGTSVWDNVHIRFDTQIGNQCIIGEKSYLAYKVKVGDRVKINANRLHPNRGHHRGRRDDQRWHGIDQRSIPPRHHPRPEGATTV